MAQLIFIIVLLVSVEINHLQSSTVLSTRTMTEKQGHDVVLACRFDRLSDRDRVMWSKDGVVLSVNQEISGDRNKFEIIGKYDLIIKKISSNDSGRYLCQNFDQATSMTVVLNVLTRPSEPQLSQSNETLIEKNIGVFICSSYGGNPAPTFIWLINQQTINQSFVLVSPNISELRLPLEKRFDQNELTCQVMNKALDHPLITSRKLNVQYKPEVNLRHGSNEVTNLNVLVIENDRLTLDCHVQSNPLSKEPLTWLKNGASLPGAQSSSLTLSNIKRSDEGEYTCLTSNIIGHGQASVHLRVQYAPIVRLNNVGVVQENQRLTLTCLTDAYPQIETYQWFKNDQAISLTTNSPRSSLIIERVSKDDAAVYTCQAKNTLKYSNGTLIEKFGRAQTRVLVEYAPIVRSIRPIVAVDRFVSTSIDLKCEIDSYPESNVEWIYRNEIISKSKNRKYSIRQNASISILTIETFQSNSDFGSYRCHALNKLGNDSSVIIVRSKDVPQSPNNITVIKKTYSSIHLQWTEGFDGGWSQTFQVSLNKTFINETNQTEIILTHLQHNQLYHISIRAKNRLGESLNETSIELKTSDVPVTREELPFIESSSIHLTEKFLDFRLNNESFLNLKIPLCLHIEIVNETNRCERIVTSSGVIPLSEIDPLNIVNVSICLDGYEEFCGESLPVDLKREVSFNWLFILIASILIVFLLILCALCLFCFIQNCKRRRRYDHQSKTTKSTTHPIVIEPISSPTKYLPSSSYVEQHSVDKSINRLIVTTAGHLPSSASGSSDPIISNGNASSLSGSEQLTVTDFCPNDLSYKSYLNPTDAPLPLVSTAQTDLLWSQSQYGSYGFPFYPSNQFHEIVSTKAMNKEDSAESGYSTPSKAHHVNNNNNNNNKKTVYEVVV